MTEALPHQAGDDRLWLTAGLLLSAGFVASLLGLPALTVAAALTTCLAFSLLGRFTDRAVLLLIGITAVAHHRYGPKTLTWDVISFELPNYFDWAHGLRGAYWDYSKLTSMYFGVASTFDAPGMGLMYGLTCVAFCLATCTLYTTLTSRLQWTFFLGVLVILWKVANSLFILGKGDLLCTSFLMLTLAHVLRFLRAPASEATYSSLFMSIMFAALAISTKLSSALFAIPLTLAMVPRLFDVRRYGLTLLVGGALAAALFSPFIFNLVRYHALTDPDAIDIASRYTIAANLGDFFGHMAPTVHRIPVIITLIVAASGYKVLCNRRTWLHLWIWAVLCANILFTPWAYLHGAASMENYRLIAFPLLALLALCHED